MLEEKLPIHSTIIIIVPVSTCITLGYGPLRHSFSSSKRRHFGNNMIL